MNALSTTLRLLPDRNNINRLTLHGALARFGTPKQEFRTRLGYRNGTKSFMLQRLGEFELMDLLQAAHRHWKAGCKAIQSQFAKNHEVAARWNALWQRIKLLFAKRGVKLNGQ